MGVLEILGGEEGARAGGAKWQGPLGWPPSVLIAAVFIVGVPLSHNTEISRRVETVYVSQYLAGSQCSEKHLNE